ncbi:MAG: metallophosphoesterase family protein [Candidatus Sumerlaeaceae bacterium]|jgi:putative phosphoesterase
MHIEGLDPRRIAIFSDIHANLPALEKVLEEIDASNVDFTVCCGDVVGYGAHPNECVELLRSRNIPTIAGNHDYAALSLIDITYFNEIAKRSIQWTRKVLTPENEDFLRNLPLSLEVADMLFVHASPRTPEAWNYVITLGDARQAFRSFGQKICFIGHSHTPFVVENFDENLTCPTSPVVELKPNARYLVNVGSVGQPRDRNPEACFALYDREKQQVEIRRVEYDLARAQQAIFDAGLPVELAERLNYGM